MSNVKNKLMLNYDNVVIGSRTLEEYKFQIVNFMNMLYSNIHYSDDEEYFSTGNCMTISVVAHNLKCFIKDAYNKSQEISIIKIGDICETVDIIYTRLKSVDDNKHKSDDIIVRQIKEECSLIWNILLKKLTETFNLKYNIAPPEV